MRSSLSVAFKSIIHRLGDTGESGQISVTMFPRRDEILTENELKKYDGTNPHLSIYIALDGDVYDVSKGSHCYGPTGNCHIFAGRDTARALVTGCFKDHLTHDIRGLSSRELKSLQNWKRFYDNHYKYHRVGIVVHEPIDPGTPIPPPCKNPIGQKP